MTTSEDREQISDVLIRYATGIDTKNWPLFESCFAPDAISDFGGVGRWTDALSITAEMAERHEKYGQTAHSLTNFVIDVQGDTATATSYVHAVLVLAGDPDSWADAIGKYEDKLVRTPAGWKIAERKNHVARFLTHGNLPSIKH